MDQKKTSLSSFLVSLFILLSAAQLKAKTFENEYLRAEIPNNWSCVLQENEWVCSDEHSGSQKKSVLIITAKATNPEDSIESFEAYLSKPRPPIKFQTPNILSQVLSVSKKNINTQWWVEAIHYGSEVENYFTHYLSTVKGGLAILASFSVTSSDYENYIDTIEAFTESLKIIAEGDTLYPRASSGSAPIVSGGAQPIAENPAPQTGLTNKFQGKNKRLFILGISLIIAIGFLAYALKK